MYDRDYGVISPGLLHYYKNMLITLPANMYITLSIVNSAQSTAYGIIT